MPVAPGGEQNAPGRTVRRAGRFSGRFSGRGAGRRVVLAGVGRSGTGEAVTSGRFTLHQTPARLANVPSVRPARTATSGWRDRDAASIALSSAVSALPVHPARRSAPARTV